MTAGFSPLVLIGTVHRTAGGGLPLRQLLQDLAPGRLTLELSPYAVSYRQTRGTVLRQRLERILARLAAEGGRSVAELAARPPIADIRSLLALPFEYLAAADHAAAAGIPLDLIDASAVSAAKLARVESELITYRNIRTLVHLEPGTEAGGREDAAAARRLVLGKAGAEVRQAFLAGRRGREGIGERDLRMAARIRRLRTAYPEQRLVHIGGWVHLVADPRGETLYSRLRDLSPCRLLLGEPSDSTAEGG